MDENLFDKVNIKRENTHLLNGLAEDVEKECADYEKLIASLGGIDLQLLGIGVNGHIGFNEPDTSFRNTTHLVSLTESTRAANSRLFEDKTQVPKQALSMGIGTIMRAKKIVLIASGKNKAEAVRDTITGHIVPSVPASILQFHQDVTIVCDEDAYSLLK